MSEHHSEIIIVKRHGGHEDEHHGGAWKIAFADFMTAMMTFFLVLWIVNATDKNTKTVIARYFNPVRLEEPAKGHKGVHNESTGGNMDAKDAKEDATTTPAFSETLTAEKTKNPAATDNLSSSKAVSQKPVGAAEPYDAAHPTQTIPESALMADPYGSLDRIAGPVSATEVPGGGGKVSNPSARGATDTESFQDPFEPVGGPSNEADAQESPSEEHPANPPDHPSRAKESPPTDPIKAAPATPTSAVLPPPSPAAPSWDAAPKDAKASEAKKILNELRVKLGSGNHGPGPGIEVRSTSEGLLISLTDQLDFSMFAVGSAEPQPQVVKAMAVIAKTLVDHSGAIIIRGHTDARPYHSQAYDNWRLSEARAQMAYYMLTRAHINEKRIEHIEGYADRRPKNARNPYAAENRRIEILVREAE